MISHYIALAVCVLLTALGQILLRAGMLSATIWRTGYVHLLTLTGYVFFVVNAVLAVYVLQAVELKIAVAFGALAFPLVVIASRIFLKEQIAPRSIVGSVFILLGIAVFGLG